MIRKHHKRATIQSYESVLLPSMLSVTAKSAVPHLCPLEFPREKQYICDSIVNLTQHWTNCEASVLSTRQAMPSHFRWANEVAWVNMDFTESKALFASPVSAIS